MGTLLIRDAAHVETFDDANRVLRDASIFVRDGAIEALGPAQEMPRDADRVVDARVIATLRPHARLGAVLKIEAAMTPVTRLTAALPAPAVFAGAIDRHVGEPSAVAFGDLQELCRV